VSTRARRSACSGRRGGRTGAVLDDVKETIGHQLLLCRVERPERPVKKQGRQAVYGRPRGGVEAFPTIGRQYSRGNQVIDATDQDLKRMMLTVGAFGLGGRSD
jgi:hypothetical protein